MKPTCKTYPDGVKKWWLNGKLHKEWYLNNKLHREDGPAIEWPGGDKYWFLNSKHYSELDYYRELYKLGKITKEELFIKLL